MVTNVLSYFFTLKFTGRANANFMSNLLSVVFAVYTELIMIFEMECLI